MAITTAESFLVVLEKSELLTTEQFAEAQDATLLTNDAAEMAEMLVRQGLLTSWQASQLLAGRSTLFLGNYALMDFLGRGGMGSVFLAKHRTMKRRVALKVVSKQVGKDPASLDRFLAEARAIASLDHPNIVRAYDVDKESDRFYIVMEYVEGQDLESIVREHGLFGYEEVADCIRQAADGLAHAHGRNMIHCDIKPSNLLLSDQGVIKILDMGMARLIGDEEDSSEQHRHKILGTVDYMSPEQAMEGPDFDHRADIYSLGCTLYFLLTGRPPFNQGSLTERIVKHQTQQPPDIMRLHPDAPRELVDICNKMMAKNPADRYQTAEEISRLLTGWREPSRTAAAPADKPPQEPQSPATIPSSQMQPVPVAASQPIETLDASGVAVAGPTLDSKPKRTWSEEQQTVILVAAAVFCAIVVLSVALVVMIYRGGPSDTPVTRIIHTDKSSAPSAKPETQPQQDIVPQPSPPIQTQTVVPAQPPQPDNKTSQPAAPPEITKKSADTKPPAPAPRSWTDEKPQITKTPAAETTPGDDAKTPQAEAVKPEPPDPFADFPTAVDLKLLPSSLRRPTEERIPPFKLASLRTAAGSSAQIELAGGDAALAGKPRFTLAPVAGDQGEPAWLVRLERGGQTAAAEETFDVARIWLGQGALVFEWLKDAAAESANHLKNCALKITVDGKTRLLALQRPRSLPPLAPDLMAGKAFAALSNECLPDADNLRLEITSLQCDEAGILIKQNCVIKARERADINLSVGNLQNLVVRASYGISGGQTILEIECFFKPGENKRLLPMKAAEWYKLEMAANELLMTKQKLTAEIARQKRSESALARKQQQLAVIDGRLEEAVNLMKFKEAVHEKGKIFFREFVEADGQRIELSNTDPPTEAKEGEGQ